MSTTDAHTRSAQRKKEFGTLRGALRQKKNVMKAVALRDMRTRFFNHGLGFLIVTLWPLAHMIILLAIYTFAGRTAPYGDSLNVFFATGLIPTLTFVYVSRFMALSLLMNRPMLAFPIVNPLDIMTARAVLEGIASCLTVASMFILLIFMGEDPFPADAVEAFSAYTTVLFLAFSVGITAGVIGACFPFFVTIYSLSTILIYVSSGVLFVAPSLPDQIAVPLSYNPVLQCVEWMRVAYFLSYDGRLLDREYVLIFALVMLFLGLLLERLVRRPLRDG